MGGGLAKSEHCVWHHTAESVGDLWFRRPWAVTRMPVPRCLHCVCVCVSVTFFNQLFSVVIVFLFKIMCASRMRGGGEWRRSTTEKAGLWKTMICKRCYITMLKITANTKTKMGNIFLRNKTVISIHGFVYIFFVFSCSPLFCALPSLFLSLPYPCTRIRRFSFCFYSKENSSITWHIEKNTLLYKI